jgi:hypothetical protein
MRTYIQSLPAMLFGAFVAAIVAPASIFLFHPPQKAETVLGVMMLTFLTASAGFGLVHLPVFLAVRSFFRVRSARILPFAFGTLFCFIPVILITILFMGDSDGPQGLWANIRLAFAVNAETLPWYFGFAIGGMVFLEALRQVLARQQQET